MASSRRSFLKKGLIGGALLAIAGLVPIGLRGTRRGAAPKKPLRLLSDDEYAVLAAIATHVVPGDGAGPGWPSAAAVDVAGEIDAVMARVHPLTGKEFKQLLRLFENGLIGLLSTATPTPFSRASPAAQTARLESWRRSRLAVLRSGYLALTRLIHAAYFGAEAVWPHIGYPGPPDLAGVPVVATTPPPAPPAPATTAPNAPTAPAPDGVPPDPDATPAAPIAPPDPAAPGEGTGP